MHNIEQRPTWIHVIQMETKSRKFSRALIQQTHISILSTRSGQCEYLGNGIKKKCRLFFFFYYTFSTIMRHCVPFPDAGAPEIITLSGASFRAAAAAPSDARQRRPIPCQTTRRLAPDGKQPRACPVHTIGQTRGPSRNRTNPGPAIRGGGGGDGRDGRGGGGSAAAGQGGGRRRRRRGAQRESGAAVGPRRGEGSGGHGRRRGGGGGRHLRDDDEGSARRTASVRACVCVEGREGVCGLELASRADVAPLSSRGGQAWDPRSAWNRAEVGKETTSSIPSEVWIYRGKSTIPPLVIKI